MTWVYGWPLDEEYAIQLARDLKLIKDDDADDADYVLASVDYIAGKADWEHTPTCWVGKELRIIFGAYVDERLRAHPPQRVIMSRATPLANWYRLAKWMELKNCGWYRYSDGSYHPGAGELWEETYLGEDDDLVEYVSYDPDEDEYESDECEETDSASSHSSVATEASELDAHQSVTACSGQDVDADATSNDGSPDAKDGGSGELANELAPRFGMRSLVSLVSLLNGGWL